MTPISRLCIGGPMDGQFFATMDDAEPIFEAPDGSRLRYEKYTFCVRWPESMRIFRRVKAGHYRLFISGELPSDRVIMEALEKAEAEIDVAMESSPSVRGLRTG